MARDLRKVVAHGLRGDRFTFNVGSAGLLRPDLSLPAYAGLVPANGLAPVFNFFDRTGGGMRFGPTVRRSTQRDYRGGRLSYEEHDGTDFVCPPGTPIVAAAPGVLVATRDNWLCGGLTACVEHGSGVVTQYAHLSIVTKAIGEPIARGEQIGLSGTSGYDLTQFFPWIPPHLHFQVRINGRPVDPYLAFGETRSLGVWFHRNDPQAAVGPLSSDPSPEVLLHSDADLRVADSLASQCLSPDVAGELERAPSDVARAAILEDSLHHDRDAWPARLHGANVRLASARPRDVRLTLPLAAALYRGAVASDERVHSLSNFASLRGRSMS